MRDIPTRVIWFLAYTVAALLLLGGQLYRLTVEQSETYRGQAERNMLRELPSYGPRGNITDRNGRPLAISEPAFAALLLDQDPRHVGAMN